MTALIHNAQFIIKSAVSDVRVRTLIKVNEFTSDNVARERRLCADGCNGGINNVSKNLHRRSGRYDRS